ncbi:PTS sugar transporter subunit IIA [Candidatus Haliotispira prima]|uniref:PTS sugar transporter subunit IIA n=1 Tax=Candidatus Haliotispira prima TaxID=3034016 RepID=A0ABY8MKE6_9SPIO|nr:PTS sugar transporter subunit IIA [Candidatus Haliotispira prima]
MAVDWLDLIQADFVDLQKEFGSKDEILEFLADRFSQSHKLTKCNRDDILRALQGREAQGSTGLGGGIAVPHCGLKKATGFAVAIITLGGGGIDFRAFDSAPCNLIISIVGPEAERNHHVQILASLASGLQKAEEVQVLLGCSDKDQAMGILGSMFSVDFLAARSSPAPSVPVTHSAANQAEGAFDSAVALACGFSRLSIFVQKEKFFARLLEEAVRASDGSVTVVEGHNIAEYLQRMPLYAYFLNDKKMNKFLRCIEAIVPTTELPAVYDTVQRIDKKIGKKPGILLFHQEIQGMLGSLDY